MPKILTGKVVSIKMQDTAVVNTTTMRAHPIYKKKIKRNKKIKAATQGLAIKVGDMVKIIQTRPISREKHFKVLEIVKK